MARKRRPPIKDPIGMTSGNGRRYKIKKSSREVQIKQTLPQLTIAWVQTNGVPFSTAQGFFARALVGNTVVDTTFFDRFGVARFNRIPTLTNQTFTLQIFRISDNRLFRTRTIPAGVQIFAVIG